MADFCEPLTEAEAVATCWGWRGFFTSRWQRHEDALVIRRVFIGSPGARPSASFVLQTQDIRT
jgi:hypothetical protein